MILACIFIFGNLNLVKAQVTVVGSAAQDGTYASLTKAAGAFAALNGASQAGRTITITLTNTGNLAEDGANALTGGAGMWTTLQIYPTISGVIITGGVAKPLIDLNGADNVTIDGRVNASGSTKDLIITNTSTSSTAGTSTIRFFANATGNTVKYCTIKGSETVTTSGIIFFSTAATGGNDGNLIDNCNITADAAGRPKNAICAIGSASPNDNSGNTISNNNIYDFLNKGASSQGIYIGSNNTNWTITSNSFYETASFAPTASVDYILIYLVNSGNDFVITNNYIGGSAANCSGTWTKTNAFNNNFYAISLSVGSVTPSSIQNNTITNFNISNSLNATFAGIDIWGSGAVNVGTVTQNIIGATTGTGAITLTNTTAGGTCLGIYISSTGTVDIQNNKVGSITTAAPATIDFDISCIQKAGVAGTTTISNNTIGSLTTANSINASSTSSSSTQQVTGIINQGTGTITISGNVIANLKNACTFTTNVLVHGIGITAGSTTVSGNTIRDLTASGGTSSGATASLVGISIVAATTNHTVSNNTIYNLSNTNASDAVLVYGIQFSSSTGANLVERNFIHSLSVSSTSATAVVGGIYILTGVTTYKNNIISIVGNSNTIYYGIYENGALNNNNSIFFNSVYLGGSPTSGSVNSYALYSNASTNTRDFRNNIFNNSRSNNGATGSHYAAYFNYTASTNITLDYNDYYAPGSGGVLGFWNSANKTALPIVTGKDAASIPFNPFFTSAGSTTATDYSPLAHNLYGVAIGGITTDYAAATRAATPTMGAIEGTQTTLVDIYNGVTYRASYYTLKQAFDAINAGTWTGALTVKINGSTVETASAVLNNNGNVSGANYSSVNIYPTLTGLTIYGNLVTPLIDLNGADNITIDGRVNAAGAAKDLVITNISTSATAGTSTIRFITDATNNIVKYCTIKGSETDASSGILFFSTAAAGGNDGNLIDNCNITMDAAGRPINAVFSLGTSAQENSENSITNNNIYDFLSKSTVSSNGIFISSFNDSWSITGNSFYESSSFVSTSSTPAYIVVNINNTGSNYVITGNNFGGQSASCGGSPWTKTNALNNAFTAIYLNAGAGTASNIQNNTIKNFSYSNSASADFTCISVAGGDVNVGTVTANTIGDALTTGSIIFNAGSTGAIFYGINIPTSCTGTVDVQKNIISGITVSNSAATACNFYGINKANVAGTTTISNNTIGSTTIANSIHANSLSNANSQSVYGIKTAGTGTITVANNTVGNMANASTYTTAGSSLIHGINIVSGTTSATGNVVRDLTIAGGIGTTTSSSVVGILLSNASYNYTVSQNTIFNLSNTYNGATATYVYGLYYNSDAGTNLVERNFIHSLSSASSSSSAIIGGINIVAGTTTYQNNIISLTSSASGAAMYGIINAGGITKIYFNTVSFSGATAGATADACLYTSSTNTRNIRNNIFANVRTGGGTHNAISISSVSNLTIGFNDYVGAFAFAVTLNTAPDNNSITSSPSFTSVGGTVATNYHANATDLYGIPVSGITTDYSTTSRAGTPTIGAIEGTLANLNVDIYQASVYQTSYARLFSAFDAINNGLYTGSLRIKIKGNITELGTAVLNASGTNGGSGTSNYTGVTINPTGGATRTITGTVSGASIIELNGADSVRIDGLNTESNSLTIENLSIATGTSTIKLTDDATTNTITNSTILGSAIPGSATSHGGNIFFSTKGGSNNTGNDNNIISNCKIGNSSGGLPARAIWSYGSTGAGTENSNNTVIGCEIYNYACATISHGGIMLYDGNTDWTISNNKFYQTTSRSLSNAHYAIYVNKAINTGNNFQISGNYIGGSAADGTGTYSITAGGTNTFTGIYIEAGTVTTSAINNNTIKNISQSTTAAAGDNFMGIHVINGNINIGTTIGNTIGDDSNTGSIYVSANATGTNVYGINLATTAVGTVDIRNNVIAGITTNNTAATPAASNFYGINKSAAAGTTTMSGNTIGSTTIANSINASSASSVAAQTVYGIKNAGTGTITISGNTIGKLTNASTFGTGNSLIHGINTVDGINTVSGNTIRDLTIVGGNGTDANSSVVGILQTSTDDGQNITGNTIYGLSNSNATIADIVYGIHYAGSIGTNVVEKNFIHSLSAATTSATAVVSGININGGTTSYKNNIISLTFSASGAFVHGIRDAAGINGLYFNTVSLSGATTGATADACIYTTATNTKNIRNNIFANVRTGGGTHSATNFSSSTGLTLGYNDYVGVFSGAGHTGVNISPDNNSITSSPSFLSVGSTTAADYTPAAHNLYGIAGIGITTDYSGATRATWPTMGAIEGTQPVNVEVFQTVTLATYPNLYQAFNAINAGTHTGALDIKINGSITEITSAVLNATGGSANYSSVHIYPTLTGLTVNGSLASYPLIDFNGADNVTLDGRVDATGTTKDMVITNTSTSSAGSTSTIRFINDATSNTVKYCTIKGSESSISLGLIYFSTTTGSSGNDNNLIDNCNITADAAGRPTNGIYSAGTSTKENGSITISNNNFYDLFSNTAAVSTMLNISSSTDVVTITGNSFYETTSLTGGAADGNIYNIIYNGANSTFNGTISGNYLGGAASSCGGSAFTMNASFQNTFNGINIVAGSASIQNNTIKNISWTTNTGDATSSNFYAMNVTANDAKTISIGNTLANTIGSNTVNGSITVTNNNSTTFNSFYGIYASTVLTGALNIQNNIFSGITAVGSATTSGYSITGIHVSNLTAGSIATISNNTIGSTTLANSLYSSSLANTVSGDQTIKGINIPSGNATSVATISGNTISNFTNAYNRSGLGIYSLRGIEVAHINNIGQYSITNNIINNLTTSADGTNAANLAGIVGISMQSTSALVQTVSGNTISNLSNTGTANVASKVVGIVVNGGTGPNVISKNFIYGLSDVSTSTSSEIDGIVANAGTNTFSNNIVSLTFASSGALVQGISDVAGTNNYYFNTVSVSGSPVAGTTISSAFISPGTNTRNIRNNIFSNARTTNGTHYAANLTSTTGLTINYNDYYGVGGVLNIFNAVAKNTLGTWQTATSQDVNSLNTIPSFSSVGGTVATNYTPAATNLLGTDISTILDDYSSNPRHADPSMGAFEVSVIAKINIYKAGVLQWSYNTLKTAFDDVNNGTHTGSLVFEVASSTTESVSAIINASGSGSANYSAISIYPVANTLSISGSFATPLITLNGADNITINGRLNNGAKSTSSDLTLKNTSTAAGSSAIMFQNDASTNTITKCNIYSYNGNTGAATDGAVIFSTTTGSTGNDGNTISESNIGSDDNTKLVGHAILSDGTASKHNNDNNISSNSIFDFSANAIYLASNAENWTISGNSFYNTKASNTIAADNYVINVPSTANCSNLSISGNYIGGRSASCGGAAFTVTSATASTNFIPMSIFANAGSITINSNTIQNIAYSQSASGGIDRGFIGMDLFGSSNFTVGQSGSANNFGTTTGTGSIVTSGAAQADLNCIKINGTGTNSVAYNIFGAISQTATTANLYIVQVTGVSITSVSNNTIGSSDANNMINTSNGTTAVLNFTSTGTYTASNNRIQQFNPTHNSGAIYVIQSSGGSSLTSAGNTIIDITPAQTFRAYSVSGATNASITGNSITNINQTAGYSTIIYSSAGTTNTISGNTINDINLTTTSTTTPLFTAITAAGAAAITLGTQANPNIIGSTTGVSSATEGISITNNAGSNGDICLLRLVGTSGAVSCAYNQIGGIKINGSNTTGILSLVENAGSATTTIDNNIFGNSVVDNMDFIASMTEEWIIGTGSTFSVTNNTFQNVKISTVANIDISGIYNPSTSCVLTCTGNTFSKISSTATGAFYLIEDGIPGTYHRVSSNINSNNADNITINGASAFYLIYLLNSGSGGGAKTFTINSNTFGNAIANNMTISSNTPTYGIYFDGSANAVGGTLSCDGNTFQNFNLTSTGTSNVFNGLYFNPNLAGSTATISFTNNLITDITSNTKNITVPGICAIYFLSNNGTTSAQNLITGNYFQKLTLNPGAANGILCGYYHPDLKTDCTFKNNHIYDFANTSTGGTGIIYGIYDRRNTASASGNYYINNAIIIDNESNTNSVTIYGIYTDYVGMSEASTPSGPFYYHNTVKIAGTMAAGTNKNTAVYVYPQTGGSGNVQNNIFQNTRTGGTGGNYAVMYNSKGTFNYNYMEVTENTSKLWYSGADKSSNIGAQGIINQGISIAALGNVPAATTADIKSNGITLAAVTTDIDGNARATGAVTIPCGTCGGPWRGAYESFAALPVSLFSFEAKLLNRNVVLNWTTTSEVNNDFFTIEKSNDAANFEFVKNIAGAGNSNALLNYETVDETPFSGTSYYRLKQTDFDGNFTYSEIRSVYCSSDQISDCIHVSQAALPTKIITVSVCDESIHVDLTVYDMLGRIMFFKHCANAEQKTDYIISTDVFPVSGMYLLVVQTNKESLTSKITITK